MASKSIVKIPDRSGLDMSHSNSFTASCGTLTPCFMDYLLPNDTVKLSVPNIQVQLPPMATDFYGRVDARVECFFVPFRILYGGWQSCIAPQLTSIGSYTPSSGSNTSIYRKAIRPAFIALVASDDYHYSTGHNPFSKGASSSSGYYENLLNKCYRPGSLFDYLGYNIGDDVMDQFSVYKADAYKVLLLNSMFTPDSSSTVLNSFGGSDPDVFMDLFPFLAYHKIYDDWYRDARLQKPVFCAPVADSVSSYGRREYAFYSVANIPYLTFFEDDGGISYSNVKNNFFPYLTYPITYAFDSSTSIGHYSTDPFMFNDGSFLFDLRQRSWTRDVFTNATYAPQQGDAASVSLNDEGTFTIAQLRAANALQQFLERQNIGGNRYNDMIYTQYGIRPSDAITNRSIYLGGFSVPVYNKTVLQTGGVNQATNNPFDTVASKYAMSQACGDGSLCRSFTASEHGLILAIFSLVPRATYSTATRPQLWQASEAGIAYPVLAGIGDESIPEYLLHGFGLSTSNNSTFGYTQRYSFYKFMFDEVHGLLKDGQSLAAFQLQRYISAGGGSSIGSSFIEIPTSYLDQVSAVSGDVSKYGCWVESFFSYKKVTTLPQYTIPTLEDAPTHGHYESVNNGGVRL